MLFDLDERTRETSVQLLKKLLADEYLLFTKTYNFHWNVHGIHFNDLHALFVTQYEQLETFFDDVAERIRALGYPAPGTMAEFLQLTRLEENPGTVPTAKEMMHFLLVDHTTIIELIRADLKTTAELNDMGTNNFLNDLMMKHEKTAWMLRATLED